MTFAMKLFIWLSMVGSLLTASVRLYKLGSSNTVWPRQIKWTRSEYATSIVLSVLWITFGLWILYGRR